MHLVQTDREPVCESQFRLHMGYKAMLTTSASPELGRLTFNDQSRKDQKNAKRIIAEHNGFQESKTQRQRKLHNPCCRHHQYHQINITYNTFKSVSNIDIGHHYSCTGI